MESNNKCNKPKLSRSGVASPTVDPYILPVACSFGFTSHSDVEQHVVTPTSSASSSQSLGFPSHYDEFSAGVDEIRSPCDGFDSYDCCHGIARSLSASLSYDIASDAVVGEVSEDVMDFFLSFEFDELTDFS